MALDPVKNLVKILVAQKYTAGDVSIQVETGKGATLPDPATDGAFNLVWWNSTDYPDPSDDPNVEIVRCTAKSGDTLTIARAQESTLASTKNTNGKKYYVILGLTKKTMDSINTHIVDVNNPHNVTKTQVGLGNVDNTSDVNKPVSTAQATAIALKATDLDAYTAAPMIAQKVMYQNARGDSEFNGDQSYGGQPVLGFYELLPSNMVINKVTLNAWKSGSGNVTMKIFKRNDLTPFDINVVTPDYQATILSANFPTTANPVGNEFTLTSNLTVTLFNGGITYLMVFFQSASEVTISRWTTEAVGLPARHAFMLAVSGTVFGFSSPAPIGPYGQTAMKLAGPNDITKLTVPAYGPEKILNGGFETTPGAGGALFTSWEDGGYTGNSIESSLVHGGTKAVKMVGQDANWYKPQQRQDITVTPGSTYEYSFWTRGDGTNQGWYAVYDKTHLAYITSNTQTGITGTTYTKKTVTFLVPAGCTTVTLYLGGGGVVGGTSYFDDVSCKEITTVTINLLLKLIDMINSIPAAGVTFSGAGMSSTNVATAILEAFNRAQTLNWPRIILPPEITAVVGDNLQVFIRGIIEAQDPYALPYNIISAVGTALPRFFDFTPVVGDVGTKALTVKVFDNARTEVATATTNLIVVNPTGQPATQKNVLCVGDSLTAGGTWPQEAYRRLTQAGGTPTGKSYGNISFIGDVPMGGFATQGFVAWGGWSYANHMGTSYLTSGYVLNGVHDKVRADMNSIYAYGSSQYRIMEVEGKLKLMLYSGTDVPPSGGGTFTWVSGGTNHADIVYTSYIIEPGASVFWDNALSRVSFNTWSTRLGTEVILNPGFDTLGANPPVFASWNEIDGGQGTISSETSLVHTSGGKACKMTKTSGATQYYPQTSQTRTVVPGQRYEFSVWTRGDGTNAGVYAIYDVTHSTYIQSFVTTGITGTTYTKFTYQFTAPAGCTSMFFMLNPANVVGAVAYFDDASVKPVINIDVAYILLGWNELGTGPLATDHATAITQAKTMIDRLHIDYPSCLVRLLGVEIPSFNGGLGTNYGAGTLADYYLTVRNANGYNLAMASIAADPSYSSFVRFLGIASQFDSENNMPQTTAAVNARNATTEVRQTNGVHPDTSGYYQIADVVYRDFIRTFCSS